MAHFFPRNTSMPLPSCLFSKVHQHLACPGAGSNAICAPKTWFSTVVCFSQVPIEAGWCMSGCQPLSHTAGTDPKMWRWRWMEMYQLATQCCWLLSSEPRALSFRHAHRAFSSPDKLQATTRQVDLMGFFVGDEKEGRGLQLQSLKLNFPPSYYSHFVEVHQQHWNSL